MTRLASAVSACFPGCLGVLLLFPGTASAHGGLSALGALKGLVYMLFGAYLLALIIGGIVLHVVTRRRRKAAGRPFFLRNREIPPGLRAMMLLQYALAFVCLQILLVPLVDPYLLERFDILYYLIFALLAVLSANGYGGRSLNSGFRLGTALGIYCVVGVLMIFSREGWRIGLEWVVLGYGMLLLFALSWKYRSYFGVARPGKIFRLVGTLILWSGLALGSLIVIYCGGSLLSTTVFPPVEADARAVLDRVADAMVEFKDERGYWPTDLDQLDSSVDLRYRWTRVEYDADKNELWLSVRIPIEKPDLAFRLTYGFQGRTGHIDRISKRLQ